MDTLVVAFESNTGRRQNEVRRFVNYLHGGVNWNLFETQETRIQKKLAAAALKRAESARKWERALDRMSEKHQNNDDARARARASAEEHAALHPNSRNAWLYANGHEADADADYVNEQHQSVIGMAAPSVYSEQAAPYAHYREKAAQELTELLNEGDREHNVHENMMRKNVAARKAQERLDKFNARASV